ncbi:hypothetical protein ACEZCY_35960 [Streptacidiphilus sp. N1-12]|uniref:Uncharacterized protein n=1 Tax=Streptacidiphilus alkalitolerans TaxID=3342712 RepID=A0ABV6WS19_9ACTN
MSDHQFNGDLAHEPQHPHLSPADAQRQQADEALRRSREATAKARQPAPATG